MNRLFIFCSIILLISSTAAYAADPKKEYRTLIHELLDTERRALSVETQLRPPEIYAAMFKVLNKFVYESRLEIQQRNLDVSRARREKGEALRILRAIDDVMVENNFLLHVKTGLLTDTFSPSIARPQFHYTEKRRNYFNEHKNELFYHWDCDLGSFLFLAVAEELSLPLTFIEIPDHYFVRWTFNDGRNFNWDINIAGEFTDDNYRNLRSPRSRYYFDADQEHWNKYLTNLTDDDILGYHYFALGIELAESNHLELAETYYKHSIEKRPASTLGINNLSWMYLTHQKFAYPRYARVALELSLRVDAIDPREKNSKDTLSCAYAANGMFEKAIEVERVAYNKQEKLDGYQSGKNCLSLIEAGELKR